MQSYLNNYYCTDSHYMPLKNLHIMDLTSDKNIISLYDDRLPEIKQFLSPS
jgi:hypothetical protein